MRTPRAAQVLNLAFAVVALALLVGVGTSSGSPKIRLANATGALSLSNSREGAAIFRADAMRPGDEAGGSVRISNTGSVAATLHVAPTPAVDVPGSGGGRLSNRLELLVIDVTVVLSPVTVYAGRLKAMDTVDLGRLAPGDERQYLFVATLRPAGNSDNALQGAQLAAGFTWTAQGAALPTPTATPEPTPIATPAGPGAPAPQPPPATPPPVASGPPAAGATLGDQVFSMPSPRRCVSRRKFAIHVRRPKGVTFKRVTITVNGRTKVRLQGLKARKLRTAVNLRGLPKGKVLVEIVAATTNGGRLTSKRTYHTCTKRIAKRTKQRG